MLWALVLQNRGKIVLLGNPLNLGKDPLEGPRDPVELMANSYYFPNIPYKY